MAPIRAGKSHKQSKKNTTGKVGANIVRCGRWVLQQTKIRKARGIQSTTPPRQVPSKVSVKKKKHSSSPVPSEQSCTGENSIPVARMADDLSDIGMWGYSTVETFINIMLDEGKFARLKKSYKTFVALKVNQTGLGWDEATGTVTMSDTEWQLYLQGKRKSEDGHSCGRSHPSKMVRKDYAYEQIAFCQKAKGEWYQTVKIQNTEQVDPKSETLAIEILNSLQSFVDPNQFLKAFNKLADNLQLRKSFVQLHPDMRRFWVENLE
ncbi:hypothetical protein RHSIM_RhsimUnG0028300 [Rhododendron simsii]|uniref:Myb/SANT-like domain-containing protein n=1 Tax=Rhododendron simsii TaxID=118357 RepID=A0A834L5P4_RHOSS|nr:hypothetical protein RHSIM_RhsimUnG0028300 [Rhododendron simsii]